MMPHIPIAYIDIRFFAHATEDLNKVIEAVQRLLPAHHVDDIMFKRHDLRGHYGNPISFFESKITSREIINTFIENLTSRLNRLDKETLRREFDLHTAKGSLYIRLDKQALLLGELKLCTADPVRVRIRFSKKKTEDVIQICRELGFFPKPP